jgi:hypothetical protein
VFKEAATLYLVFFSLSLIAIYLTVRRGRMGTLTAAAAGSVINALCIFIYAIFVGDGLIQALVSSLSTGILFAVAAATCAAYFRKQTLKASEVVQRPAQADIVLLAK